MAHHEFLRRLGIFTIPGFLTPEECALWRGLAHATGGVEARVYRDREVHLDVQHRKTLEVSVKDTVRDEMKKRILKLRDDLERNFQVKLGGLDTLSCLVYRPGDFFRLHSDATAPGTVETEERFQRLGRRKVSVVVFLNGPHHLAEPYQGGALTLYGLMGTEKSKEYGFPVDAEAGLLVAFPASTLHEVAEVTSGKRYTLVTWFLDAEPTEAHGANHTDVQTQVQGGN